MADILKVTQPINPGIDNNTLNNNPIVPGDKKIQNIVDPSKIVRPDGKTEKEDSRFEYRPDSNYEGFISQLRSNPRLYSFFERFLFLDFKTMITSGMDEGVAKEVSEFMKLMEMDAGQLLEYMKNQATGAGRYSGIFFQAMREVFEQTSSIHLKSELLEFLKHYNNLASGEHLLESVITTSKGLQAYLLSDDADALAEILASLSTGANSENMGATRLDVLEAAVKRNSGILLDQLLPFFGRYIEKTHDMGRVRDQISLIIHNISRYVDGTPENILYSLGRLLGHTEFEKKFQGMDTDNLRQILNNLLKTDEPNARENAFVNMLRAGLNSYENKGNFMNIMNSMLLNQSVYMPLIHLLVPASLDGHAMFSEIWVDPDAEGDGSGNRREKNQRNIRLLVRCDLKEVGLLDVILNYRGGQVDLSVYYPPKLADEEKNIKAALNDILKENGLSPRTIALEKSRKSPELTEVFPKLAEGRNSIDVRI